jgi:hypothetical protein
MGIHLLHYVHGNEHTGTHDAICNTFAAIVHDAGFHVGQEQLHAFSSTTLNSSRQRFNIILTKDDIRILTDVVIVNPMQVDLFPRSCAIQGFVVSDAIQAKERNYRNRHPTDQFLPLTIEVFGCLHKHVNMFLHNYVNAIWNLKGT